MDIARWERPVMIVCKRSGQLVAVTSTIEALNTLLNSWPTSEGKAFFCALQICNAAIDNPALDHEAREAFVEAARDADIPFEYVLAA